MSDNFINTILHGDAFEKLKLLADNSVDCCVTSPPYYSLRDYGVHGQIGLEKSPEEFISVLVGVFREVKRVLKSDGTLWLNIGDSYWGGKGKSGQSYSSEAQQERYENGLSISRGQHQIAGAGKTRPVDGKHPVIKPKDLVGIPWMLAFALRADGWYLRQDIIWHKTTSMPESVVDRCTKNHEYIFLLSKSPKYFYDNKSIMQPAKDSADDQRRLLQQKSGNKTEPDDLRNGLRVRKSGNKERKPGSHRGCPDGTGSNVCSSVPWEGVMANKRSVWTVAPRPFTEAHFATYPQELIVDCIKAGCPIGGIVLDPFFGAGTTGLVARKLGRNYIGIELNEKYIKEIAEPRLNRELGLFI